MQGVRQVVPVAVRASAPGGSDRISTLSTAGAGLSDGKSSDGTHDEHADIRTPQAATAMTRLIVCPRALSWTSVKIIQDETMSAQRLQCFESDALQMSVGFRRVQLGTMLPKRVRLTYRGVEFRSAQILGREGDVISNFCGKSREGE